MFFRRENTLGEKIESEIFKFFVFLGSVIMKSVVMACIFYPIIFLIGASRRHTASKQYQEMSWRMIQEELEEIRRIASEKKKSRENVKETEDTNDEISSSSREHELE